MLFIFLTVLFSSVALLSLKLMNVEAENLGKVSSLKLEIKEKDKEIADLKKRVEQFKINDDVDV